MYLTKEDLTTYYPDAENMPVNEVTKYLARANSYAQGIIGGPLPAEKVDDGLKSAVGLAFEIMAKGETAQADAVTGNITEISPAGFFAKKPDPLATVKVMLEPYAKYYDRINAATAERGVRFL